MKNENRLRCFVHLFFLFFLVFVFGCTQNDVLEKDKESDGKGNEFLDNQFFCNVDADCALGRLSDEAECFTANKLYFSKLVSEKGAMQNCEGKAVECVMNVCVLKDVESEPIEMCVTDEDCVPAECCHATSCVLKSQAPNCDDVMCTMECREDTLDCGGRCICVEGKCEAVFV